MKQYDTMQQLKSKIDQLEMENAQLRSHRKVVFLKAIEIPLSDKLLTSDKKVKYYTGLPSKAQYEVLFKFINSKMKKARYWRGDKNTVVNRVRKFIATPKKFGPR